MSLQQALESALALHRAGQFKEAEALYLRVLDVAPGQPDALHYLGVLAFQANQFDRAIDLMQRAIAAWPDMPEMHNHLSMALEAAGRLEESEACQRRLLQRWPRHPGARGVLGSTLAALGRMTDAIECFRTEIALQPGHAATHGNLGAALSEIGLCEEGIEHSRRAVELDANPVAHSNLLMQMHFHPGLTWDCILAEHQRWWQRHGAPLASQRLPHDPARAHGGPLRIGYVSPDFRDHVVAHAIEPVLAGHDRTRFAVYCYSDAPRADWITRRLRTHASVWRDTCGLDDAALARLIRQDGIDILVDLTLHMPGNRMLVFARKPAPVQVTYVGYASTTGMPTMDCRIGDPHMDPPGAEDQGPEQIARLPACYWCYRPPADVPVGPLPALRNGHITFGSFNSHKKVNHAVTAAWAGILRAVPGSRLILVLRGSERNEHVWRAFEAQGVARGRLRLLEPLPAEQYLKLHDEVDIALDTFPYNGGITSLNSLWMGVPFVTLAGQRAVGRAGTTLLTNVGLGAWIASNAGQYHQLNVDLASDLPRLQDLRCGLRDRLRQSPLMDEARFVADLERIYCDLWAGQQAAGETAP